MGMEGCVFVLASEVWDGFVDVSLRYGKVGEDSIELLQESDMVSESSKSL